MRENVEGVEKFEEWKREISGKPIMDVLPLFPNVYILNDDFGKSRCMELRLPPTYWLDPTTPVWVPVLIP